MGIQYSGRQVAGHHDHRDGGVGAGHGFDRQCIAGIVQPRPVILGRGFHRHAAQLGQGVYFGPRKSARLIASGTAGA